MSRPREKNESRQRVQAAAELRQRAGKNLVFGSVAAILGGVLTVWSQRSGGEIGISVTQLIYWALIGGGAMELAFGVWQMYQAREVLEGRIDVPVQPESARRPDVDASAPLEIAFTPARGKHVGWSIFVAIVGALLYFGFGGLGSAIGIGCWLLAGYRSYCWFASMLRTPQSVTIRDGLIRLPRATFGSSCAEVSSDQLKHAYLLRRSVPLLHAPPILVIDLEDESFVYPRDWFSNEAEQEQIAAALRARLAER